MTSQLVTNVQGRLPQGGEFQGRNGDCTEYAFMVGDAALDTAEPCDANELNRLTTLSINGGNAGGSGSMTAANLAWLIAKDGHPYQATSNWASALAQHGGTYPVILQVNNGSNLPGNEGGVNGHAVVALDYDSASQTLVIANGDSVNGRAGRLDTIHMSDVQAANPFACTVLLPNQGSAPTGGGTVTNANLGQGFTDYATKNNVTSAQVDGGEHFNQPNPGESWAAWDSWPVLTYTPAEGVQDHNPGRIVKFLVERLHAAEAEVAALQSQLAQASAASTREEAAEVPPAPASKHSILLTVDGATAYQGEV